MARTLKPPPTAAALLDSIRTRPPRSRLSRARMRSRTTDEAVQRVDVAIIGGGLAGLTLALQLRRELPHVSVLVVERNAHPVPEAAFKVGESTSELGAHYLRDVLGLAEHLKTQQVQKLGLRFVFTAGDKSVIARRGRVRVATSLCAS